MTPLLEKLHQEGILEIKKTANHWYYQLCSDCEIFIPKHISKILSDSYKPNEEIGGFYIVKPEKRNGKIFLNAIDVKIMKNIYPDPSGTFLMDDNDLTKAVEETCNNETGCLPIRFHSHPTEGKDPLTIASKYLFQTNTSTTDRKSGEYSYAITHRLVMPRGLLVKNGLTRTMFIGFYGGGILPSGFENYKNVLTEKMLEDVLEKSKVFFNNKENIPLIIVGGALVLFLMFKFPGFTLGTMFVLGAIIPVFMNSNMPMYENPKYFAQIQNGDVTIEFPKQLHIGFA